MNTYFQNLQKLKVSTFFQNSVFEMMKSIFQSYHCFGTRNRYHLIARSLHLCFRSILKISKKIDFHHFSSKKSLKKVIFAKVSLPSGKQIITSIKIPGGIYCLRNESEQIYFFGDFSSPRSYQLTQMSANLQNCTFPKISDPGAECFAPFFGAQATGTCGGNS